MKVLIEIKGGMIAEIFSDADAQALHITVLDYDLQERDVEYTPVTHATVSAMDEMVDAYTQEGDYEKTKGVARGHAAWLAEQEKANG